MKTKVYIFLINLCAMVAGILTLNILFDWAPGYELILFGSCGLITLAVSNFIFTKKNFHFLFYPISLFIQYIAYNLSVGITIRTASVLDYYQDQPRPVIIPIFMGVLMILYGLAFLFDYLTKFKASRIIFLITDLLTLPVSIIVVFVTIFASPA